MVPRHSPIQPLTMPFQYFNGIICAGLCSSSSILLPSLSKLQFARSKPTHDHSPALQCKPRVPSYYYIPPCLVSYKALHILRYRRIPRKFPGTHRGIQVFPPIAFVGKALGTRLSLRSLQQRAPGVRSASHILNFFLIQLSLDFAADTKTDTRTLLYARTCILQV